MIALKLLGQTYFDPSPVINILIALADYLEIPALFATTLLYLRAHIMKFEFKNIWFLFAINSQWLHIFWITDEVVVTQLTGVIPLPLPVWLAWLAIIIDYLELPVIYDTSKKFYNSVAERLIRNI